MRKFILLLLVALAANLCSCQLFAREETVEFELPEWPGYLPELLGWKLEKNGVPELAVPELGRRVEGQGSHAKSLTLRLDKNVPCSITVTPVTEVPFFKPAGTIYPYSQKITWSGGYAAKIFNTITESSQFNWEKLLEKLESCENPWLLDSQEVLEGIAYHNFNANKLKLSGVVTVPLDFGVYSSYVPENQVFLESGTISVIKNQPELFVLRHDEAFIQDSGLPVFAIIISASSAKKISLEVVSMPIFKEEL